MENNQWLPSFIIAIVGGLIGATAVVIISPSQSYEEPMALDETVTTGRIKLTDANGSIFGEFWGQDEGAHAVFTENTGEERQVKLQLQGAGKPAVKLYDKGQKRIEIGLDENGNGQIQMFDTEGKVTWTAP